MASLSAVIITLNEEKNIGRCLVSLRDVADEIIVVDSFSSDRTKIICKEYGAVFIEKEWKGYIWQKNFANEFATNEWILSVDADEALSDSLKHSILKVKDQADHDAYTLNRITNYCGQWIKHCGWYPDTKLRLFKKSKGKWAGYKIHEYIEMQEGSSEGHLDGDLLHYSYYSISDHMRQANHFSNIAAEALYDNKKKAGIIKLFFAPIFRFIRDYFFKLGFMDGFYGFVICQISAHAVFLKYIKLRQYYRDGKKTHHHQQNR